MPRLACPPVRNTEKFNFQRGGEVILGPAKVGDSAAFLLSFKRKQGSLVDVGLVKETGKKTASSRLKGVNLSLVCCIQAGCRSTWNKSGSFTMSTLLLFLKTTTSSDVESENRHGTNCFLSVDDDDIVGSKSSNETSVVATPSEICVAAATG